MSDGTKGPNDEVDVDDTGAAPERGTETEDRADRPGQDPAGVAGESGIARRDLVKALASAPVLGPSPGFENLKWLKPVFAGDTLTYYGTFTGRRELRSRPGWGMVNAFNEAENQDGNLVFSFEGHVMIAL